MGNKELIEKYPFLTVRNVWTDEILDTEYTQFDMIPDGWRKAFGMQMIEELNSILVKAGCIDDYRIIQIKEKFGALRWYDNGIPKNAFEEYTAWADKYSELSARVCINCGKPATKLSRGWICPYCDDCASKMKYTDFDEIID